MDTQEQVAAHDSDWLLQHLVELVNTGAASRVNVVLTTPAGLISGQMIGGAEYFDLYGASFTKGWAPTEKDLMLDLIETWKLDFAPAEQPDSTVEPISNQSTDLPSFIHLKDARVFNAGTVLPTDTGMLWRGRLADITGFTLGTLGCSSRDDAAGCLKESS